MTAADRAPAPKLAGHQLAEYARIEAADPAPESFDATAAVRRVLALADEAQARTEEMDSPLLATVFVISIRAAVEGAR